MFPIRSLIVSCCSSNCWPLWPHHASNLRNCMKCKLKWKQLILGILSVINKYIHIYLFSCSSKQACVLAWQKTKTPSTKWVQHIAFSSEALITRYQMDDKGNLWSISFALFWSVLTFKVKPGLASFHLTVIAHAGWAHLVEKVIILWSSCCNKIGHNPKRNI